MAAIPVIKFSPSFDPAVTEADLSLSAAWLKSIKIEARLIPVMEGYIYRFVETVAPVLVLHTRQNQFIIAGSLNGQNCSFRLGSDTRLKFSFGLIVGSLTAEL